MKGIILETENPLNYNYRLDMDIYQLKLLQKYIQKIDNIRDEDIPMFNEIKEIVKTPKKIKRSIKKMAAADKATEARTAKAKEKIQNAINILRMENKKITHYSIAKTAGVSYLTVKKYITLNEIT